MFKSISKPLVHFLPKVSSCWLFHLCFLRLWLIFVYWKLNVLNSRLSWFNYLVVLCNGLEDVNNILVFVWLLVIWITKEFKVQLLLFVPLAI